MGMIYAIAFYALASLALLISWRTLRAALRDSSPVDTLPSARIHKMRASSVTSWRTLADYFY